MAGFWDFLFGSKGKRENVSTLRPEQEETYKQLQAASQGRNEGGAFGQAGEYYKGLMSSNSADAQAFANPMLREYGEDIVPGLSEQFAGMGAGGLSSSGFRNAQVQGATDLAERIGRMRAELRQAGAQGLQNLGQQALGQYSQNMQTEAPTQGFLQQVAPLAGKIAGAYMGVPI